ncbi:hypothetical protein C5B96_06525 [Subtercola sp. Z020]|uniref:hypothetical protein n=1 Tax=Subtercola sp. Z020 TaxID=2080582 RepID=UPI000CE7AA35|nr:hypothetical protein [Subtercola sp. Z020]PPF85183.1 hypothetical protein C5B96_06525 [Subtercola sp. Z020]
MKASRLLKAQRRAQRALAAAAERSHLRAIDDDLHELGRLRREGELSEREFQARRQSILSPVVARRVLS